MLGTMKMSPFPLLFTQSFIHVLGWKNYIANNVCVLFSFHIVNLKLIVLIVH